MPPRASPRRPPGCPAAPPTRYTTTSASPTLRRRVADLAPSRRATPADRSPPIASRPTPTPRSRDSRAARRCRSCRCRRRRRSERAASYRARRPPACASQRFDAIGDPRRRVGPRQRARRAPPSRAPPLRIGQPAPSARRASRRPSAPARRSPSPRPPARATSAFLRWWSSVAVGSGTRIAGRARRGQLGQRRRPGAADDQVGRLHLAVHFVDEGLDARRRARRVGSVAHQIQIALAGLVGDRKACARRLPAAALPPPWPR